MLIIRRQSKPDEAKAFIVGNGHEDSLRGQHQSSAICVEKSESGSNLSKVERRKWWSSDNGAAMVAVRRAAVLVEALRSAAVGMGSGGGQRRLQWMRDDGGWRIER
ncbi:hypothetical protein CDL15_Pgr008668 [Punica granatum]|uniref:Uncharacterized protein n=1 Tax=Punica granatum TaxID=22663 RepID=A0A218XCW2_PUNGR|nr:hypothetical protein CDL15_Pgr008668 [Punica granatum]PKI61621.1 hypothetical protein CRG98_017996 [Punica granatum]